MDYDANLGEITVQDREYALDLMADLEDDNEGQSALETIAQWFRKVRYEAVMADRKQRETVDYDANLGEITVQDREYALDLMADLEDDNEGQSALETIAQWFRKVRCEAVMADRKQRETK